MTLEQDLRIGRVTVHEGFTASSSGDGRLDVTGQESTPGLEDLARSTIAARISGLLALEGRVVPVAFAAKPELDGYYRVDAVTADTFEFGGDFVRVDWSLTATRVAEPAVARHELRLRALHRANGHAITVGDRWTALPPDRTWGELPAGGTVATRTGQDGDVLVYYDWTADTATAAFGTLPIDYYTGAALLELGGETIEGTVLPAGDGWAVDSWRLSNGLVRATARPAGDNYWFRLEAWDPADGEWQRIADVRPVAYTTDLLVPVSLEALRNTADAVTLRAVFAVTDTGAPRRVTVDLSLRRGSRYVAILVRSPSSTTLKVQTTITGWDDLTGVRRATSADADGNKTAIGAAYYSTDTRGVQRAASTELAGFVAGIVDSATAATVDDAAALLAQWLDEPLTDGRTIRA